MVTLVEAFNKASTEVLTKTIDGDTAFGGSQRGGTCGLYSLWYASVLLKYVDPNDVRPPIYPRKCMGSNGGPSIRKFAKTVGSAQGEVLNQVEMVQIVKNSGYECDVTNSTDSELRKEFIRSWLAKDRPILLAYLEGGVPGTGCHPARAYSMDYAGGTGAHWALIVDENASEYGIIDPHWPNTIRYYPKDQVLQSNAAADDGESLPESEPKSNTSPKVYVYGDTKKRQMLKCLLVSVY